MSCTECKHCQELDAVKVAAVKYRELAEAMHKFMCTINHTDGCDWDYFGWDSDNIGYTKKTYLAGAQKMAQEWGSAQAAITALEASVQTLKKFKQGLR